MKMPFVNILLIPLKCYDDLKHVVDLVIDSGAGGNVPSTILDCTNDGIEVIRQGLGDLDAYW